MTPLVEIGEIGLSDSTEDGPDYLLRPSFDAMNRLGTPLEIVQIYAAVHGDEAQRLLERRDLNPECFTSLLSPSMRRAADRILSHSMLVLQACCTVDLTRLIGEWKGWKHCVVYRPGSLPRGDIILLAQSLMQHGVVGKAKVRKLQRNESNDTTSEFKPFEYINAARSHFSMSREEACNLTMTEFQLLLSQKYPEPKGLTREEYDAVADDFLERQAARRAAAKQK